MSATAGSLQRRLLVLGLVSAVWLGSAALTWRDTRHELDGLLDGHMAQAAALLVVQHVGDTEDDAPAVDAPMLHRQAPKIAFQVFHEGWLVES
jgi:two-component system sensor histidine kinase QseC